MNVYKLKLQKQQMKKNQYLNNRRIWFIVYVKCLNFNNAFDIKDKQTYEKS